MLFDLSPEDVATLVVVNIAVQDLIDNMDDEDALEELEAVRVPLDKLVMGLDARLKESPRQAV